MARVHLDANGLTRQRERFCQLIARSGLNAADCYAQANNIRRKSRDFCASAANTWLNVPLIRERISAIQASVDWDQIEPKWKVYRQLVELYEKCVNAEAWAAAAKVIELKLKALQMLSDKILIDDMRKVSDDELIKRLAASDPVAQRILKDAMGVKDSFPNDNAKQVDAA